MSLLDDTPTKLPPQSCGLCRLWAPWLRQEFLGTCGGATNAGRCMDRFDTCADFKPKAILQELLA